MKFHDALAEELGSIFSMSNVDAHDDSRSLLRGWTVQCVELEKAMSGDVLEVRAVNDVGSACVVRIDALKVPEEYAQPMPGEEDLPDEGVTFLAANLALLVKELLETHEGQGGIISVDF